MFSYFDCNKQKHFRFIIEQVPPFLQEATNSSNSTDGAAGGKYEGYIVDLLDEITRHLCVSYEISLAADGKFGSQQGEDWTGIIGDVVKGVTIILCSDRACVNISINVKCSFSHRE